MPTANEKDLIHNLREDDQLRLRAADELERVIQQREDLIEEGKRVPQARVALELYRDGLKHGEQNYDDLQQAMELLGSAPEKFRIRKRKAMSRAELTLRIDGMMEKLEEVAGLVAKMARDPNATPQAQTNAKSIQKIVDAAKTEVSADIEACGAAVSGIPAGKTSPITDYCTLEEGHEGDHVGTTLKWPQEAVGATA